MDSTTTYEKVTKILEGHRRGHYDLQQAVSLLEMLWHQQSEDGRKDMENAFLTTLSSEPVTTPRPVGRFSPDVLRVVIRAMATFGPTASLPDLVFARLPSGKPHLIDVWAHGACYELRYSMFHNADRFTQGTLERTKALCAPYTFSGGAELTGSEIPKVVIDAAADLERTIEQIEFSRFAGSLREDQQQPRAYVADQQRPTGEQPVAISGAAQRQHANANRWDVFISHASEDKDAIARLLAQALEAAGLSVWYDEFSLRVGDSLRNSIDHGLANSEFGVVILSKHFFEKHWPAQELNGLATREVNGKKVILPVWHGVGFDEVRQYSPMLAGRVAVTTDKGVVHVVEQLLAAMK
jgi:hypothetical protein